MTTDIKKTLLIGGAGLGGIVVLALLMKKPAAGNQILQPTPIRDQTAPNIASYPVMQIQPAPITAVDAPQFMTFNFPDQRQLVQPSEPKQDGCGCGCDEEKHIGPVINDSMLTRGYAAVKSFITFTPKG